MTGESFTHGIDGRQYRNRLVKRVHRRFDETVVHVSRECGGLVAEAFMAGNLAVIKIEADHDLPTASLGNSDGVQVGDWVLAFGSPFGLNSTVTAGIVSAKDRATEGHQQP